MRALLSVMGVTLLFASSARANFADRCMGELSPAEKNTVRAIFKATGHKSELSWESCESVQATIESKVSLDLSGQNLTDIGIVAEFPNLRVLNLAQNHLEDISALAGMKELRILLLSQNHLKNLDALAELWNLAQLEVTGNLLTEVGALRNLEWLRSLNIAKNQVSDISAVSQLTHLQFFWAAENKITEVASLAGLWDLRIASLANNPIKDFSSLAPLEVTHQDSNGEEIKLQVIGKPVPVVTPCPQPCTSCGTVVTAPCGSCGTSWVHAGSYPVRRRCN